jgi:hypothetical protein
MMKRVSYHCKCGNEFSVHTEKPQMMMTCPSCHKEVRRDFGNISSQVESAQVSAAIQQMLYAGMPSGKDKAVY